METIIKVEQVTKSYPLPGGGSVPVLQGITMDIRQGTLVILKGRSGSGKTTLLNLLCALDEPSGGTLWFGGQKLAALT